MPGIGPGLSLTRDEWLVRRVRKVVFLLVVASGDLEMAAAARRCRTAGRQTLNSHAYASVNVEQLMTSDADDEQTIWQRMCVDDLWF